MNPYADSASYYWRLGWRGVLPIPLGRKEPPPEGFTGAGDVWPSYPDVMAWSEDAPANVALRLPDGVIGLDVDAYPPKAGGTTLADAEARWGPLPPTWRATSRDDGLSGIYLFRVPPGLRWPGEIGPNVEIIQRRHRYMVAPPSVHPNGNIYRWYFGNELVSSGPAIDDLPWLPDAWVQGITAGAAELHLNKAEISTSAAVAWAETLPGGMCRQVTDVVARVDWSAGSRHDTATRVAMHLARLAVEGHTGVPEALGTVGVSFVAALGSERSAGPEWSRILLGAVGVVQGQRLTPADPCVDIGAGIMRSGATIPPQRSKSAPAPATEDHTSRELDATPASQIEPQPVTWLWAGRIPSGALTLLAGREGKGKSTVAYWLAAEFTHGRVAGMFYGEKRPVFIGATEDSWEHVIVPRLMVHGADLDLIYRIQVIDPDYELPLPLVLPRDVSLTRRKIEQLKPAIFILDPLISRVDGALDTHRDSDVRRALEPLIAMTHATDTSVLGIIHPNKSTTSDPLNALMGSRAFPALARSVLSVVDDPDDEDGKVRLFGLTKCNVGPTDIPVRKFQIVTGHARSRLGVDLTAGRIEWLGESETSISDAMAQSHEKSRGHSQTKKTKVQDFVMGWLERHGETLGSALRAEVTAAGIASEPTCSRALRELAQQNMILRVPTDQGHNEMIKPHPSRAGGVNK